MIAFVAGSIVSEERAGVPFDTTYRIVCAVVCLWFIRDFEEQFPGRFRLSFYLAVALNIGLFYTPIMERPASRGELMLFALPDAIVVLAVEIATYEVRDDRQRANRQMMILALVAAIILCAALLGAIALEVKRAGSASLYQPSSWREALLG